ncbi:hypothetical protein DFH07DRAFT_841499 [Mycena maculata]|uniref:Uncharacterized protein n=1 Tax=Mycena maculata TaxID=230809 RepID=A0AAD7MYP1_9AGAR|nr:hypothetical protein DFH07DRAFT_841499 [Mycena maculata]
MNIWKREVPKIGGSAAGFIAVVVLLVVIILASTATIFYLLRDNELTPRDRTLNTHAPRLRTLFGRGVPSTSQGRGGWIQASGDAWEADEADRREMSMHPSVGPVPVDAPFRPPPITDPFASDSSMWYGGASSYAPSHSAMSRSDSRADSMPFSRTDDSTSRFADPRSTSPQSTSTARTPKRVRPESAVTGSDWEAAASRGHDREEQDGDASGDERSRTRAQRHFSVESAESGVSVHTFEGGTKFLEGL